MLFDKVSLVPHNMLNTKICCVCSLPAILKINEADTAAAKLPLDIVFDFLRRRVVKADLNVVIIGISIGAFVTASQYSAE